VTLSTIRPETVDGKIYHCDDSDRERLCEHWPDEEDVVRNY
jgi:hypothetical protein